MPFLDGGQNWYLKELLDPKGIIHGFHLMELKMAEELAIGPNWPGGIQLGLGVVWHVVIVIKLILFVIMILCMFSWNLCGLGTLFLATPFFPFPSLFFYSSFRQFS